MHRIGRILRVQYNFYCSEYDNINCDHSYEFEISKSRSWTKVVSQYLARVYLPRILILWFTPAWANKTFSVLARRSGGGGVFGHCTGHRSSGRVYISWFHISHSRHSPAGLTPLPIESTVDIHTLRVKSISAKNDWYKNRPIHKQDLTIVMKIIKRRRKMEVHCFPGHSFNITLIHPPNRPQ